MATFISHISGTAKVSSTTFGALDMGGASAQITFFRVEQDILANMVKLQIGGQKHWNIYAHSFLGFGQSAARLRLDQALVKSMGPLVLSPGGNSDVVVNPCLPKGYVREEPP